MITIEGSVAPGFESVRALYERNMRSLAEENTQLCIYVGEQRVVDLWASATNDPDFSADSLVNVFSSGKSLESIALAMLVDRGLLRFDAKVSEYWPEFAGSGKDDLTVADLMRHEAGLANFQTTLEPGDLHPDGIRKNAIGTVVERETPRFRPGDDQRREYHAITRGWVANEIFRRVEPSGRTMGQFFREEIREPLGADVFIGLREEELPRVKRGRMVALAFYLIQSLLPKAFGRRMELNLFQLIAKVARLFRSLRRAPATTRKPPPPISGITGVAQLAAVFDSPAVSKGETPSAGAKASARGLARLAAVMANRGTLAGRRYLGDEAWEAVHGEPIERDMIAMRTTFTQGGLARFPAPRPTDSKLEAGLNHGREGYFGWMGFGGSIFQWHPERRIGFAYVPTLLNVLDICNERGKAYQAEVLRCVERLDSPLATADPISRRASAGYQSSP